MLVKQEALYYCGSCRVTRTKATDEWRADSYTGGGSSTYVAKDRHYGTRLTFPDGTTVWASSSHSRKKGEPKPDFGLYLATSWASNADCLAHYINWTDMGLPTIDWNVVIWAIEQAFESAKTINVEVGCVGGHGRTGTVLACMATLAGVKPGNAVKWVRKHYCEHAVESDDQAWFVKWFDATRRGVKAPKRPAKKTYTSTTTATVKTGGTSAGTNFGMKAVECKASDCKANSYAAHGYCYKHNWMAGTVELEDAKPLKKVSLDTHLPLKKCKTASCEIQFRSETDLYCVKCREERAFKYKDGLPKCPWCHDQMTYNKQMDEVLCYTQDCGIEYTRETEEFGWVFYDAIDQEVAAEKGDLDFGPVDFPDDAEIDRLVLEWEDRKVDAPKEGGSPANFPLERGIETIIDDIRAYNEEQEHKDGLVYLRALGRKDCAFCKKPFALSYNPERKFGTYICFNEDCDQSPSDDYLHSLPGIFIFPDELDEVVEEKKEDNAS